MEGKSRLRSCPSLNLALISVGVLPSIVASIRHEPALVKSPVEQFSILAATGSRPQPRPPAHRVATMSARLPGPAGGFARTPPTSTPLESRPTAAGPLPRRVRGVDHLSQTRPLLRLRHPNRQPPSVPFRNPQRLAGRRPPIRAARLTPSVVLLPPHAAQGCTRRPRTHADCFLVLGVASDLSKPPKCPLLGRFSAPRADWTVRCIIAAPSGSPSRTPDTSSCGPRRSSRNRIGGTSRA